MTFVLVTLKVHAKQWLALRKMSLAKKGFDKNIMSKKILHLICFVKLSYLKHTLIYVLIL